MNSPQSQRTAAFGRTGRYALFLLLTAPIWASARDPGAFFQQNCAGCHTIGGGSSMGPDLRNVQDRKDRKWLVDFLVNPQATLDKGDPYGKKILADANGMVMPAVDGVDRARAESLLDWIASQSTSAASTPATQPASAEPGFTPADAELGQRIVMGRQPLANGGAACSACHAFRGLPLPGGGALGPDLSKEFIRLGGRQGLTPWLSTPPTPTMQAAYKAHPLKPEEITAIAAYLESIAKSQASVVAPGRQLFPLLGAGGCLLALGLMELLWRKRFTAVRRRLVAVTRSSR